MSGDPTLEVANTRQVLRQVRTALRSIDETTSRSRIKWLLDAADVALNTLQLQESPEFYREYIATGRALVAERSSLATTGEALNGESVDAQIAAIRRALVAIVARLDESRSAEDKHYLRRMSDWEAAYYTHHLQQAANPAAACEAPLRQADLQAYLERRHPEWQDLKITKFAPLEGGFSKLTLFFETDDRLNGTQALVMRAEQPFDLLCYAGSEVAREYHMVQLMRRSGLPTAEPLWLETNPQHLGCRFIVSRKAQGRVYGGALGSDDKLPAALLQSLMATFIQMHNITIAARDPLAVQSHLEEWLPYKDSLHETTRYYVTEWLPRMIGRTKIASSPQVERALKWLQANIPESNETAVVMHGDFSFNNLIFDDRGVTAVLDWESSRLGDPAEDIIWTQPNINAYMSMPEFLEQYRAGTGRKISAQRLAYARVVKCVLNAVACLSANHGLETRSDTQVNLAVLAYKYMGLFGAQFNALIESAEQS